MIGPVTEGRHYRFEIPQLIIKRLSISARNGVRNWMCPLGTNKMYVTMALKILGIEQQRTVISERQGTKEMSPSLPPVLLALKNLQIKETS